jgi:hypothetical protein
MTEAGAAIVGMTEAGGVDFRSEVVDGGAWRVRVYQQGGKRQLSWEEVLGLWRSAQFAIAFQRRLASSPHRAFFWETPPLTSAQRSTTPFEYVTVPAPHLEHIDPDPHTFEASIGGDRRGSGGAATFQNLGGDSTLVSPCEDARAVATHERGQYAHIAAFARGASAEQAAAFWRAVADAVEQMLDQRGMDPLWVSTEGSGVSWLHVRLDPRPKYAARPHAGAGWPHAHRDAPLC